MQNIAEILLVIKTQTDCLKSVFDTRMDLEGSCFTEGSYEAHLRLREEPTLLQVVTSQNEMGFDIT